MVRNNDSGRTFLVELAEGTEGTRAAEILRRLMPKLGFLYEAQRPEGEALDVRRADAVPVFEASTPASHCLCTTYTCMSSPGMGVSYVFHDERLAAIQRAGWAYQDSCEGNNLYQQLELRTLQVIFGMLSALQSGDALDI
ncbi:MAG: hypothetical protein R6V12_20260 [Candidatus Hydrogenedentota bacterium]